MQRASLAKRKTTTRRRSPRSRRSKRRTQTAHPPVEFDQEWVARVQALKNDPTLTLLPTEKMLSDITSTTSTPEEGLYSPAKLQKLQTKFENDPFKGWLAAEGTNPLHEWLYADKGTSSSSGSLYVPPPLTNAAAPTPQKFDNRVKPDDKFIVFFIGTHGQYNTKNNEIYNTNIPNGINMLNRIVFSVAGCDNLSYVPDDYPLGSKKHILEDVVHLCNDLKNTGKLVYGAKLRNDLDRTRSMLHYRKIYNINPLSFYKRELEEAKNRFPQTFRSEMYIYDHININRIPTKLYIINLPSKTSAGDGLFENIFVAYQQNGNLKLTDNFEPVAADRKENTGWNIAGNVYPESDSTSDKPAGSETAYECLFCEKNREKYKAYYNEYKNKLITTTAKLINLALDYGYDKIQLIDFSCENFVDVETLKEPDDTRIIRAKRRELLNPYINPDTGYVV